MCDSLKLFLWMSSLHFDFVVQQACNHLHGPCTLAETVRYQCLRMRNRNLAILHCVAEYPPEDSQTNLRNIDTIKKCYPEYTVGSLIIY